LPHEGKTGGGREKETKKEKERNRRFAKPATLFAMTDKKPFS